MAVLGDELALGTKMEFAVTRVCPRPVRQLHFEKAGTFERQVGGQSGCAQRAGLQVEADCAAGDYKSSTIQSAKSWRNSRLNGRKGDFLLARSGDRAGGEIFGDDFLPTR